MASLFFAPAWAEQHVTPGWPRQIPARTTHIRGVLAAAALQPHTVRLRINDPEQLKLIRKGDQIEGVDAESIAIPVVAVPKKTRKWIATIVTPRS